MKIEETLFAEIWRTFLNTSDKENSRKSAQIIN